MVTYDYYRYFYLYREVTVFSNAYPCIEILWVPFSIFLVLILQFKGT
ncbi:hypothetical protein COCOBI_pt-0870 (chloroplast) [Coccomyxa sp. Obi]|nr:hypothetical protein COCOBI_pt-0870 [Coccomyxa sp. Obi]